MAPIFEPQQQNLIPVWHPWPGEEVTLSFSQTGSGERRYGDGATRAARECRWAVASGPVQLEFDVECSLGGDFIIEFDPDAEITSLNLDGQLIPVRRDGEAS